MKLSLRNIENIFWNIIYRERFLEMMQKEIFINIVIKIAFL